MWEVGATVDPCHLGARNFTGDAVDYGVENLRAVLPVYQKGWSRYLGSISFSKGRNLGGKLPDRLLVLFRHPLNRFRKLFKRSLPVHDTVQIVSQGSVEVTPLESG